MPVSTVRNEINVPAGTRQFDRVHGLRNRQLPIGSVVVRSEIGDPRSVVLSSHNRLAVCIRGSHQ